MLLSILALYFFNDAHSVPQHQRPRQRATFSVLQYHKSDT